MKITFWKRFISIFCCTIMLFMTLAGDVQAAEQHMVDSDVALLESISEKIDRGLEENLGYVEILETLTEEEWAAFRREAERKYSTDVSGMVSAIQLEGEQLEEAAYIDSLAQEYYDYYYGENAEGDPAELDAIIAGEFVNDEIQTYAAVAEPSDIIKMLGYTYTASQIASQLVKVGTMMSLSAALPFVQMLAIITGAGILMLTMIVSYSAVAVGVNQQLGIWYMRQISYMEEARAISARVAIEEKRGCKYWHAGLANWFNLGGIAVGPAMKTKAEAQAVVLENDMYHNVFAVNESYAVGLASSTSVPAGNFVGKETHVVDKDNNPKPLNVPHYHAMFNGRHGKTHIFFPGFY